MARLCAAFDLFDAGVDLMRQNLRRRYPRAPAREIEERLAEWLRESRSGRGRQRSPVQSSLARAAEDLTELGFRFTRVGGLAVWGGGSPDVYATRSPVAGVGGASFIPSIRRSLAQAPSATT
jgi:hypothetical protein